MCLLRRAGRGCVALCMPSTARCALLPCASSCVRAGGGVVALLPRCWPVLLMFAHSLARLALAAALCAVQLSL
jgi:hypothetical protein